MDTKEKADRCSQPDFVHPKISAFGPVCVDECYAQASHAFHLYYRPSPFLY